MKARILSKSLFLTTIIINNLCGFMKNIPAFPDSNIKGSMLISRILFIWWNQIISGIYLGGTSLHSSNDLPPGIGRAALNCRYIWSFNPKDAQLYRLPGILVSSYLTFSPLSCKSRTVVFFCITMPWRTSSLSEVWCSVLSGLSSLRY